MTDIIPILIDRIFACVHNIPGAIFEIHSCSNEVLNISDYQNYTRFRTYNRLEIRVVGIYGSILWSAGADLIEDDLKYLLSRLEGEQ